jgi:hypothetical protein
MSFNLPTFSTELGTTFLVRRKFCCLLVTWSTDQRLSFFARMIEERLIDVKYNVLSSCLCPCPCLRPILEDFSWNKHGQRQWNRHGYLNITMDIDIQYSRLCPWQNVMSVFISMFMFICEFCQAYFNEQLSTFVFCLVNGYLSRLTFSYL